MAKYTRPTDKITVIALKSGFDIQPRPLDLLSSALWPCI